MKNVCFRHIAAFVGWLVAWGGENVGEWEQKNVVGLFFYTPIYTIFVCSY